MEARRTLMNSKRALENEIKELISRINEAESEELYSALMDELDEKEDILVQVEYELGEVL